MFFVSLDERRYMIDQQHKHEIDTSFIYTAYRWVYNLYLQIDSNKPSQVTIVAAIAIFVELI